MCAPRAEPGASAWLNASFAALAERLSGFHFDLWTWKGDVAGDPSSMSVLVAPSRADELDLRSYEVDKDVHGLALVAFGWTPPAPSVLVEAPKGDN